MAQGDYYSIGVHEQPRHRGGGFRVRLGFYTSDLNVLSRTVLEERVRTKAQADRLVREWQRDYPTATVI